MSVQAERGMLSRKDLSLQPFLSGPWPGSRKAWAPGDIFALKRKEKRLFSELRLKTEGVSQKVAKVAKVWR